MKNCQILSSRDDVHNACYGLLRSKPFKQSYQQRGVIFQAIDQYANLPRIICDYSDYELERSHFYPYWGVLPKRDYGSQLALSDLYYYHEQGHSIVAGYQERQPFSLWVNRLTQEEARTSVQSEMAIYFHLPELRKEVFQDMTIWADRFLNEDIKIFEGKQHRLPHNLSNISSNWDLFEADPELFTLFAMEKRADIMHTSSPNLLDPQEQLIHSYAANNYQWANIWRPIRASVEKSMLILKQASQIDRDHAIKTHLAFLIENQGSGSCPFEQQAHQFYNIMQNFKKRLNVAYMDQSS